MNNIDEIVSKQTNNKTFDKNAWKEKKAKERNEAYELIEQTSKEIVQDSNKFKSYIDIQSRFDKYSVCNALLIVAQKPNATIIKDFENWKKEIGDSFRINNKEKGIIILEPGEPYIKEDGTQAQSFNTKSVFDISQTNVKENNKVNNYDETILLRALLKDSPVDMKVVDSLDNGKLADWNKTDNTIYICRDSDTTSLFNAISKELAKTYFNEGNSIELNEFKANCVSYMIGKKYGINVDSINIGDVPSVLKEKDSRNIRNELSSIRDTIEEMNNRMSLYFESISKTQKNKDMER